MRQWISIIAAALLLSACEEGNKPESRGGYEILVGDTLITISAEAIEFAGLLTDGNHFNFHAYMLREYQVATIPRDDGTPYSGSLIQWKNTGWNTRRTFLFPPFVHDVTTESPELFYYMIGTYPEQFGYGWVDTYDPEADLSNAALRPWLHPADSTLTPDNPGTLEFDGGLGDMLEYRAMWVVE
ncbi:hypothetical protein HUU59_05450 [bacterium]|nr:hypothetical protein [bacterium]